jgi:hypothetical protein
MDNAADTDICKGRMARTENFPPFPDRSLKHNFYNGSNLRNIGLLDGWRLAE